MSLGRALPLAAVLLTGVTGCRKPCDYKPSPPAGPFLFGSPSNQEQGFWLHATAPMGSCDDGSPEFRQVRMSVFDEAGNSLPPSRIEYVYDGVYPHSSTALFSLNYWLTVPRGGDYRFHASFPDAGWPDQGYTYIVPQHHDDAPVVVLPARCSSVGSLGPDLWLCDGALFRGDNQQWAAPTTDGGVGISRAVAGVAWVHAGNTVYRFEGDATASLHSVTLARAYEALTAGPDELFLQSPAGIARVTFDGQSLAAMEADFEMPLVANDEYGPERFDVPALVHGVQASDGVLASLSMYGRGKVRACRWWVPVNGLPLLRADDCVDEAYYLAGAGSSGAWMYNGAELIVRDYTTKPATTRYARPYGGGEDAQLYRTNRRWLYASARPKPDGSVAFDAWDFPYSYTERCAEAPRWDAEDDLAWVACGFAPSTNPVYTLVWRRPTGTP